MAHAGTVQEFLARLKHDRGINEPLVEIVFRHRGGLRDESSLRCARHELLLQAEGIGGPQGSLVPFHRILHVRCGEMEWVRHRDVDLKTRQEMARAINRAPAASGLDGVELDRFAWGALKQYQALLERWNIRYNLVSRRLGSAEIQGLVFECLAALPLLGARGGKLLDVGSGAGLPGLVLAIASPCLRATLLEPRLRRATFLDVAIRDLGLGNCVVERARLDSLTDRHFDVISLRGLDIVGCDEALRSALAKGGLVVSYESSDAERRERKGWKRLGEACIGKARAVALGPVTPADA